MLFSWKRCLPPGGAQPKGGAMDVFECAAYATVIQVAIWLLLVVIKTLNRIGRMVLKGKEKPGRHSNQSRVQ